MDIHQSTNHEFLKMDLFLWLPQKQKDDQTMYIHELILHHQQHMKAYHYVNHLIVLTLVHQPTVNVVITKMLISSDISMSTKNLSYQK